MRVLSYHWSLQDLHLYTGDLTPFIGPARGRLITFLVPAASVHWHPAVSRTSDRDQGRTCTNAARLASPHVFFFSACRICHAILIISAPWSHDSSSGWRWRCRIRPNGTSCCHLPHLGRACRRRQPRDDVYGFIENAWLSFPRWPRAHSILSVRDSIR